MPLADLFIATAAEAMAGGEAIPVPSDRAPLNNRVDIKGFDIVSMSTLWGILRGTPSDNPDVAEFPLVFESDDGECWVHELPTDLLERVLSLTPFETARVAKAWGQTDGLRAFEQSRPGLVRQVLSDLVTLAQRGRAEKKGVYLWMAL